MIVATMAALPVVDLLVGSTVLLGLGAAAGLGSSPVHRQRTAELCVGATLVWLVLALVPLPRWGALSPAANAVDEIDAATGAVAGGGPTASMVGDDDPAANTVADDGASAKPIVDIESAVDAADAPTAQRRLGDGVATSAQLVQAPIGLEGDGSPLPAGPERIGWTIGRLLVAGYAMGSLVVASYVLLGLVLLRRLRARSVPPPSWLAALFAARCRAQDVAGARLRLVSGPCRPLTVGVRRPIVILPASLADRFRSDDLTRLLDHELVHIRRNDVRGRLLFSVAAPVLWVHPLFWWLRSRAALAAELIADSAAAGDTDRRTYARTLLGLAEELQSVRPAPAIAPGAFRNRTELARRIEMLTRQDDRLATMCTPKRRTLHAVVAILAIGGCATFFGTRSLPAQQTSPEASFARTEPAPAPPAAVEAALPDDPPALDAPPSTGAREPIEAAPATGTDRPTRPFPSADASPTIGIPPTAGAAPAPARTSAPGPNDPDYEQTLALVERVFQLQTELEMAKAELPDLEQRLATGRATRSDALGAQLMIRNLQRRLDAVLILVRTEVEAAEIELAHIQKFLDLGDAGPMERVRQVRLVARLEVLRSAL